MIEPSPRPADPAGRVPPQPAVEGVQPAADAGAGTGARAFHRQQVEMMARFRRDIASTTVMLKDLTRFGARVEGVGALEVDETITLSLPGCRPSLAFVAWANAHCAGLEFAEPLPDPLFGELVARYGLSGERGITT
ncbi:MAG TPA: PilZ domain-containing protein [Novosphingobium sp.]|nr:PilZ domain-containing protein [Novosphingobium sp.]